MQPGSQHIVSWAVLEGVTMEFTIARVGVMLSCYCTLPYPAMPYHAMPCPTLPCPILPCHAQPCPALSCHAMPCYALQHIVSLVAKYTLLHFILPEFTFLFFSLFSLLICKFAQFTFPLLHYSPIPLLTICFIRFCCTYSI